MKLLLWLSLAFAAAIVWQASVLSNEKGGTTTASGSAEQVGQENREAGRVPLDDTDC